MHAIFHRGGGRSRRGQMLAFLIAPLLAMPLLTAAASPGSDDTRPEVTSSPPVALSSLDGGSYTVTLITGDRVTLTADDGDRYNVSVEHATRPDGSTPALVVETRGEGLYALPDDAAPLVDSGLLDKELFNVEYLAANGYADEASGELSLIVEYADERSATALSTAGDALVGSTETVALESINAAGVTVDKTNVSGFWTSLQVERIAGELTAQSATTLTAESATMRGESAGAFLASLGAPPSAGLPGGIERIWLDGRVSVDLDESVPQVGAPQAWQVGLDGTGVSVCVIDTGIDLTHPDIANKVVATRSFVPGEEVADGNGHGTHVASIVAGIGTASGGQYTGVAPGAQLIIAKGLNNAGTAPFTLIIEAMEWCVLDQGARIVSMSLGGDPTDGTDPASQAVNDLTAATGALFVIAAGNNGPGSFTIATPGAAASALTVGAVDKLDTLAFFSSRGPRVGDLAIKPEIIAPGVDITAARAAGTGIGAPVDDHYTSVSGTSMATPHVAGAAAILLQEHPGWDADDLKSALVSSSADLGYTVHEQGAGRVDVARAVAHQVQVSPAALDFGSFPFAEEPPLVTKTLTYANTSSAPVTLDLTVTAGRVRGGDPVPDGAVMLDANEVTVPAGGTATVNVTLNPAALEPKVSVEPELYTGTVVATGDDSTRLRTPVGFAAEAQKHSLTIRFRPPSEAQPSFPSSNPRLWVEAIDGSFDSVSGVVVADDWSGGVFLEVAVVSGTYTVQSLVGWVDPTTGLAQQALLVDPEVTVPDDTEVTLDPAAAQRVTTDTPKPNEIYNAQLQYARWVPDWVAAGGNLSTLFVPAAFHAQNFWATPTAPVTRGEMLFTTQHVLGAPQLTMEVVGPEPVVLHPVYAEYQEDSDIARFSGRRTLTLVDAGDGTPDELAGVDADGRLVLLNHSPFGCQPTRATIDRVVATGAAGILIRPHPNCALHVQLISRSSGVPVPVLGIPRPDADMLRQQLAGSEVRIRVEATPVTPYLYWLKQYEHDRIPDSLHYTVTDRDLAVINHRFHAGDTSVVNLVLRVFRPVEPIMTNGTYAGMRVPRTLTEYYGPIDPEGQVRVSHAIGPEASRLDVFDTPSRTTMVWRDSPRIPSQALPRAGVGAGFTCAGCRHGDVFYPAIPYSSASDPYQRGPVVALTGNVEGHLYRQNGEEIPPTSSPPIPFFLAYVLPPESDRYRLTEHFVNPRIAGQSVDTAWDFTSSSVTQTELADGYGCIEAQFGISTPCRSEPLIFLRYDLGLDLSNRAKAPGTHRFEVTAYHQPSPGQLPRIAGLRLWVSTDGGQEWQEARVRPLGGGQFEVLVLHRAEHRRDSDTVSLKAEAWDADGNRVEQTILSAFGLRDNAARGAGEPATNESNAIS